MNPSIETRLKSLAERFDEIEHLLADAQVIANQERFRKLSREYNEIGSAVRVYRDYRDATAQLESMQGMLKDDDPGIREMAKEEAPRLEQRIAAS